MKSGLVGRNNEKPLAQEYEKSRVSMKSGLVGRNNGSHRVAHCLRCLGLNEVRPSRPEQFHDHPQGA